MARRLAVWSRPPVRPALWRRTEARPRSPAQQRLLDPDDLEAGQGEDRLPALQQAAADHQVVADPGQGEAVVGHDAGGGGQAQPDDHGEDGHGQEGRRGGRG